MIFRIVLLTAALATAAPALADDGMAQGIVPGRTPAELLAKFTERCMAERMLIEESTPNSLVCSKVISGGRGFAAQLLIGNAYSTPPKDKMRFTAFAVGPDTQVQVQHTVETQMAFGQVKSYPGGSKVLQSNLDAMIARFAAEKVQAAESADRAQSGLATTAAALPALPSEKP